MEQETAQPGAESSVAGAMLGAQGEPAAPEPTEQGHQEAPKPAGLALPAEDAKPEEWDAFYT